MSISRKELKRVLRYSKDSGLFYWKINPTNSVSVGDIAGGLDTKGYIVIRYNLFLYKAHRLAWLYEYGVFPKAEIDHINGNKNDNRLNNLRDVTTRENSINCKTRRDNTSGAVGVHFSKGNQKWRAKISHNRVIINLGCYENIEDAIEARKQAERKYGYHKNHGRKENGDQT